MKKVLFLAMGLATMLNLASCSSDDDGNDGNGKKCLAEITVKEHPWKFGESSNYGEDYESYKYDEKGNLLEKITNYYSTSTKTRIWNRYLYTYDDRNRLIEMDVWAGGYFKHKYQYNEFDSLSVAYRYDSEGKTLSEYTYEYDNNRRLSKKTEHVPYMGPDYKYVSVYSYDGNTVKEVTTLFTNVLKDFKSSTMVWEYDSNKHLIKETYTDDVTSLMKIDNTYEYNAKGQLSRKTSREYAIGDDFSYRDYYYNEDGTIDRIHVSYSFKDDQSDLVYTYIWK